MKAMTLNDLLILMCFALSFTASLVILGILLPLTISFEYVKGMRYALITVGVACILGATMLIGPSAGFIASGGSFFNRRFLVN